MKYDKLAVWYRIENGEWKAVAEYAIPENKNAILLKFDRKNKKLLTKIKNYDII